MNDTKNFGKRHFCMKRNEIFYIHPINHRKQKHLRKVDKFNNSINSNDGYTFGESRCDQKF